MPRPARTAHHRRAGTGTAPASGTARPRRAGSTSTRPATISGSRARNTSRQVRWAVSSPATSGPTRAGTTHAAEMAPNNLGRSAGSYACPATTYSDTAMIPPPTPCTARAATNGAMCQARPAASRPAAKIPTPASSATRGPRRSPTSPPTTIPTTEATRKALNGQPYQASPWSSATAVGIAVATAIDSKATKVTSISRPAVVNRCARSKRLPELVPSTSSATPGSPFRFPVPCPSSNVRRAPAPWGPALDGGLAAGARGERQRAVGGSEVLLLAGGDLLGGGGDDRVEVADDAEVGQLEDRRLGVLVDGHDGLRGLHAGAVLDRTGDADGDVELRRDGLAGLPHLEAVGIEAGVHRGAGGADGGTEGGGAPLDDREVLRAGHPATAGDDDRGLGQLRPAALLLHHPVDHAGALGGVGDRDVDGLLGSRALRRLRGDGVAAQRVDRRAGGDLRVHDRLPGEDHLGGGAVGGDIADVGQQTTADLDRQTGGDLLPLRRGRDDDRRRGR